MDPLEWQWVAALIAVASLACLALRSRRRESALAFEDYILAALAAWMLFALAPLPPALVSLLSPQRATVAASARALAGVSPDAWLPLSAAPAATMERLLFVLPAMAVFVAAREMPLWWTDRRAWIAVAPVITVGVLEAVLGMFQFYAPTEDASTWSVSGTYVNRNNYAGLLELAFPLALTWAAALWTRQDLSRWKRAETHTTGVVLGVALLLTVATCILVRRHRVAVAHGIRSDPGGARHRGVGMADRAQEARASVDVVVAGSARVAFVDHRVRVHRCHGAASGRQPDRGRIERGAAADLERGLASVPGVPVDRRWPRHIRARPLSVPCLGTDVPRSTTRTTTICRSSPSWVSLVLLWPLRSPGPLSGAA